MKCAYFATAPEQKIEACFLLNLNGDELQTRVEPVHSYVDGLDPLGSELLV